MAAFLNLTGMTMRGKNPPSDHFLLPAHSINVDSIDEIYEGIRFRSTTGYTPIVVLVLHIGDDRHSYYQVEAGPAVETRDKTQSSTGAHSANKGRTLTAKELGEKIQRISEGNAQDFVCKCLHDDDEDDSETA